MHMKRKILRSAGRSTLVMLAIMPGFSAARAGEGMAETGPGDLEHRAVEIARQALDLDYTVGRAYFVDPDTLAAAVAIFPGGAPDHAGAASAFALGDALVMQLAFVEGRLELVKGEIIARGPEDRAHNETEDFHAYVIETLSTMREYGLEVCQINAWSASRDPAGVPVYSGPSLQSEELGRLAPPSASILPERAPAGGWRTLFAITGSVPGWFRIAEPWDPGTSYIDEPEPVDFVSFTGAGWIEARHAGAHYGDSGMPIRKLMSHPNPDAAPIDPGPAAADAQGHLRRADAMVSMLACSANWLFSESVDGNRGWWRMTCIGEEGQCR